MSNPYSDSEFREVYGVTPAGNAQALLEDYSREEAIERIARRVAAEQEFTETVDVVAMPFLARDYHFFSETLSVLQEV